MTLTMISIFQAMTRVVGVVTEVVTIVMVAVAMVT